jgi:hypothetical protein
MDDISAGAWQTSVKRQGSSAWPPRRSRPTSPATSLKVDRMGDHGYSRSRHAALWDELVLPYVARD